MDLPERLLRAKVTSRLGLTRRTFAPYSHKQLMDIVMSRLYGMDLFNSDAVQLVARYNATILLNVLDLLILYISNLNVVNNMF